MCVFLLRRILRQYQKPPGHAQVHDRPRSVCKYDLQILAASAQLPDHRSADLLRELLRLRVRHYLRAQDR